MSGSIITTSPCMERRRHGIAFDFEGKRIVRPIHVGQHILKTAVIAGDGRFLGKCARLNDIYQQDFPATYFDAAEQGAPFINQSGLH